MEERYEIRGKIGQGGLGSVYRAFDNSLKREVAIKRIITSSDPRQREEAIRQMSYETGALAAVQNPHIVTIYDVGADDDGPYVVMEYIKGNTVDELIEKAPLTWRDFREFVLQVQEGLIAAQDLGMVHRDLKPSNLMINWLPSGKFQVKIVDFGLAKFSPKPSLQTVDQNDSVYGSIFFMAPEQFERVPLDARTDMYAIGCVYYFALTGSTPFQGDTGPQVMAAHLEHRVTPLDQLRPDIPKWACDWVMWHMNRRQDDRPSSARDALQTFVSIDSVAPASQAVQEATSAQPQRPRLLIPGSTPQAATQPAPAAPGVGPVIQVPSTAASSPTSSTSRSRLVVPGAQPAPTEPTPGVASAPVESPTPSQTAPQPLLPPEGSPPTVHATTAQQALAPTALPAPAEPAPTSTPSPAPTGALPASTSPGSKFLTTSPAAKKTSATVSPTGTTSTMSTAGRFGTGPTATTSAVPAKKGLGMGAKIGIAAGLVVLCVILVSVLVSRSSKNKVTARYNEIVSQAAYPETQKVFIDGTDLGILLDTLGHGSNDNRSNVYKALAIAEAKDSTDIDGRIVDFARNAQVNNNVRKTLLDQVIRYRSNPEIVPALLDFARNAPTEEIAAAAVTAMSEMAGPDVLPDLLDLMQFGTSGAVRRSAEEVAAGIIRRSSDPNSLSTPIASAHRSASDADTRRAYIRLLGISGGDRAGEVISKALRSPTAADSIAAIEALKNWPDDGQFETLVDFIATQTNEDLRRRAFDAAAGFLTNPRLKHEESRMQDFWTRLNEQASSDREQLLVINGLGGTQTTDWALAILEDYKQGSGNVAKRADAAINNIQRQRKASAN